MRQVSHVILFAVFTILLHLNAINLSAKEFPLNISTHDVLPFVSENLPLTLNVVEKEIEVIMVTAQKRSQNLQKIPIAATVFNDTDLEKKQLNNLSDIANFTPSFAVGQFNIAQPQLYIRGIGSNEDGAGGDNSVALFSDGVYLSRSSAAMFDFYDVEHIEIIRGPQGSLYGKNAIGGAVNIISNQAKNISEQKVSLTLGSDQLYQGKALLAGSLNDENSLFGKLALLKTVQNGYIKSIQGFDLNDKNDSGIKLQLQYSEDGVDYALSFDYLQQQQSGAGRKPSGGILGDEVLPAINPIFAADPFVSFADIEGFQYKKLSGVTFTGNQQTTFGKIHLISAYRKHEFSFLNDDLAISPNEYFFDISNGGDESSEQISHELQFSRTFSNRWDALFGVYYFHEAINRTEYFTATVRSTGVSWQEGRTSSLAAFSHLIYQLSDGLQLIIGARITSDQKKISQQGQAGFVISEEYDVDNQKTWRNVSPNIAFSWQVDSANLAYFSYGKGFKSGGFQGQAPTAKAAQTPFNPENALSAELGYKTHFLNNVGWLNVAVFDTDYQDLQILELWQTIDDPVGILLTKNAAKAKLQGFEIETKISVTNDLHISFNYSYLDARYSEFYQDQRDDRTGNFLRNAPRHATAVSLSYYQELSNGELNWRYSHSYQSRKFQDPTNNLGASIPAFNVANASVVFKPNEGQWQYNLWLTNIWNQEYLLHNFPIGTLTNVTTPAPMRRFGFTANYIF